MPFLAEARAYGKPLDRAGRVLEERRWGELAALVLGPALEVALGERRASE